MDPAIKYGGGDESINKLLTSASEMVAMQEDAEVKLLAIQRSGLSSGPDLTQQAPEAIINRERELASLQESIMNSRRQTVEILHRLIEDAPRL